MPDKDTLSIEPGKFYRLRDGRKYRCYATDGDGIARIHGSVLTKGGWVQMYHGSNGRISKEKDCPGDIICEWIEKPVVDWSVMPAWAQWVAMDKDGEWFWFNEKPEYIAGCWDAWRSNRGFIPKQFNPQFTGKAEDTLTQRPA